MVVCDDPSSVPANEHRNWRSYDDPEMAMCIRKLPHSMLMSPSDLCGEPEITPDTSVVPEIAYPTPDVSPPEPSTQLQVS